VYLTQYYPVYTPYPVAFNSYSPGQMTQYQTTATSTVASLQAVAPPQQLQQTTTVQQDTATIRQQTPVAAVQTVQTTTSTQLTARVEKLEAKMDILLEAVQRIQGSATPSPGIPGRSNEPTRPGQSSAKPLGKDGFSVLVSRCAKCHNKTASDLLPDKTMKGGGHQFFFEEEGKTVLRLTTEQLTEVYKKLLSGEMPKDDKLNPEEGQAILAYLNDYKAQAKKE
jgi:hypothetical protein